MAMARNYRSCPRPTGALSRVCAVAADARVDAPPRRPRSSRGSRTWRLTIRRLAARRFLSRGDVAFVFHMICLITYVRVWMWHTTAAAAVLPGSKGFGWFFRYLTFYSYTLQLLQLLVCCLAHITREASPCAGPVETASTDAAPAAAAKGQPPSPDSNA